MIEERATFSTLSQCLQWCHYGVVVDASTVRGAGFVRFMSKNKREIEEKKPRPMRPPAADLERKPRGTDASAQAGMILSFIRRLPEDSQLHLAAAYLIGRERARARQRLTTILMRELNLPFLKRGLAYRLVQKYYGKRGIVLKDLAERFKTGRHHMEIAHRLIYEALDKLEARAETKAYAYLQGGNVLV